jgi:hypothetical protein
MKYSEFTRLVADKQLTRIDNAVCIGKRTEGKQLFLLYQIHAFYAEVCHREKENCEAMMEVFEYDEERLEPYLSVVNVNALLQPLKP